MCLTTERRPKETTKNFLNREEHITKKKVTTYKRLIAKPNSDGKLKPPFISSFGYVLGQEYSTNIKGTADTHKPLVNLFEGFHSYTTLKEAVRRKGTGEALYKCTIPKGAVLIKGMNGDCVTNRIIISSKITTPKSGVTPKVKKVFRAKTTKAKTK